MASKALRSNPGGEQPLRLPAAVVSLGLVSLFTDLSSEAIFPLLPAFLVSLGATGAFIGLVEGVAELVANTLKYLMGSVVDRSHRLKPLVLLGYGVSTLVRPMAAFALVPWHVLVVRAGDRVGKGVRTTPRDALIASATDSAIRARAYGFHRAMDHSGAVLGTLLASGLLWLYGASSGAGPANADKMRLVFLWAGLPGLVAMVCLARTVEPTRTRADLNTSNLKERMSPPLKRVLLALTLFAFANATDAFLVVKAAKLGASPALAPLLWLVLHAVKASTATAGGRLADHYGKRNSLVLGWLVYAALWAAIGFANSLVALFLLTAFMQPRMAWSKGQSAGSSLSLRRAASVARHSVSTICSSVWPRSLPARHLAWCGTNSVALGPLPDQRHLQ